MAGPSYPSYVQCYSSRVRSSRMQQCLENEKLQLNLHICQGNFEQTATGSKFVGLLKTGFSTKLSSDQTPKNQVCNGNIDNITLSDDDQLTEDTLSDIGEDCFNANEDESVDYPFITIKLIL